MLHIAERPQQRGRNAGAALRRGAVQRRRGEEMLGRLPVSLGDYVRWLIPHLFILPSCPLTSPPETQLAPIPDPVWRSDSSSFSSLSSSSKRLVIARLPEPGEK